MMTSDRHERATDRVFEAMRNDPAEIVVMVQGDEPMIKPTMVEAAVRPLLDEPRTQCVNLTACIDTEEELRDPNTIKVVLSRGGDALYFSRSAIPFLPAGGFRSGAWHKQVCVIAFRRRALREFAALSPTPLEQAESIDMLRFLEHGIPVRMVATVETTHAVDTPDDLLRVSALMTADPWPPLGTTRETP
jgi:3-deoxy-manno-octulosonate cytidylyltransferase (CMP-KDO synthetase)